MNLSPNNFPVAGTTGESGLGGKYRVDGDAINLSDILPLFLSERRATADSIWIKACVVSRDPLDPDNFGKQNVGIYRMEVKGA